MTLNHDFKRFPELTNAQLDLYEFLSPHFQIRESFPAFCTKVHDGDTVRVTMSERDFPFQVRFANSAAPELSEKGGRESRDWLKNQIEGKLVYITIDPNNRVEKWGRLLGLVSRLGIDMGEASHMFGFSVPWISRKDGKIETEKWSLPRSFS